MLQMVNEICLSVQKHIDILSSCPGREMEADILRAEEAIRNANLAVSVSLRGDSRRESTWPVGFTFVLKWFIDSLMA